MIYVRGPLSNSGFGVATQNFIKTLLADKIDVRFIPVATNSSQDRIGFNEEELKIFDSITASNAENIPEDSLWIDILSPIATLNAPVPANVKKRILYTTHETIGLHQKYVQLMNSPKYSEIWGMSSFNKISWQQAGVKKDVKIVPIVVNALEKSDKFKIKNLRKINYLVTADVSFRKGIQYLLPAWKEVFSKDDDVALILKLSMGSFGREHAKDLIKTLNSMMYQMSINEKESAPILLLPDSIDIKYMQNLYSTGDVFVSPQIAEGFGIPIAEAMSCELPIITTRCSGPVDFVNRRCGGFIELDRENPKQPIRDQHQLALDPHYAGQEFYRLDFNSLKEQLSESYKNIDQWKEKGKYAKKTIDSFRENAKNVVLESVNANI